MNTLNDLLLAIAGAPSLSGARCRGRSQLFDGSGGPDGERTRQAAQLCRRCPALPRCRTWAAEQRDRDLNGVIAGRLYTYAAHASQRRHVNGMEIAAMTVDQSGPATEQVNPGREKPDRARGQAAPHPSDNFGGVGA